MFKVIALSRIGRLLHYQNANCEKCKLRKNAKMQLPFFRKCPLFKKTLILPSLIVDAHVSDVARRGNCPLPNFTLHQSP